MHSTHTPAWTVFVVIDADDVDNLLHHQMYRFSLIAPAHIQTNLKLRETYNQIGSRDTVIRVEDQQLSGQTKAARLTQFRRQQQACGC